MKAQTKYETIVGVYLGFIWLGVYSVLQPAIATALAYTFQIAWMNTALIVVSSILMTSLIVLAGIWLASIPFQVYRWFKSNQNLFVN